MSVSEKQKQLTEKVKKLSKTIDPEEPSTQDFDEWLKFVENSLYKVKSPLAKKDTSVFLLRYIPFI